jgi:hypothetical protein
MTASRLRGRPPGHDSHGRASFGRAKINRWTLLLLVGLRCYALTAIAIAVYAFFRALH